jgi:four helix bundle protein
VNSYFLYEFEFFVSSKGAKQKTQTHRGKPMLQNFKSYNLAQALYLECQQLKAQAYIRDQLMRSSLSIVLNLAEGSAKTSGKDRKCFYEIALGSTRETQAIVALLNAPKAIALADQVGGCVFCLIHGLQ